MKIDGPGQIRNNSTVRRNGRTEGGASGSFARQIGGETTGPGNVGGSSAAGPLSGIDGLLSLQEVDDPATRASRGKMRAQDMLDRLDDLRHGLLMGKVSREKLIDLTRVVQSNRAQVDDPRLGEILDEIDLRAQVELAKLAG